MANRSHPYGYNLNREYGLSDYETGRPTRSDGPSGTSRYQTDAWDKVDQQRVDRYYAEHDDTNFSGYYGDANRYQHQGKNRFGTNHVPNSHEDRYLDSDYDYIERSHFGKGPKGWRRTPERIKDEANEALYRSSMVDASDIEVDLQDNVLILKGLANSRHEKMEAERCVESISGINDVSNQIRIRKV